MTNGFQEVVFWVLAIGTVGGAVLVVQLRDVFRAALMLVVSFLGMAGLFALLSAEFLAVVQVLIYGGAISVLIIFAVMLTRNVTQSSRGSVVQPLALVVGLMLLGLLSWGIVEAQWDVLPAQLPAVLQQVLVETPQRLGKLLVRDFVLPFEIAGVVLLAAVIGALALVRER
jgi:NADH-quinone oxidoreductase subunit J